MPDPTVEIEGNTALRCIRGDHQPEGPVEGQVPLNFAVLWVARQKIRAEETLDDELAVLIRFLQVQQRERMAGIDVVGTVGLILL